MCFRFTWNAEWDGQNPSEACHEFMGRCMMHEKREHDRLGWGLAWLIWHLFFSAQPSVKNMVCWSTLFFFELVSCRKMMFPAIHFHLSQKEGGWFTVILCDPSFRIPGTAAAISDVFGNFAMCHLVGERPSQRHPEQHWNNLLNIRI